MGMPVKERCDVDQITGEVVEDQPESADNIVIETENITTNGKKIIGELLVTDMVIGGEYDVLDKNSRWCEGSVSYCRSNLSSFNMSSFFHFRY
jgi:hypothetical protein